MCMLLFIGMSYMVNQLSRVSFLSSIVSEPVAAYRSDGHVKPQQS